MDGHNYKMENNHVYTIKEHRNTCGTITFTPKSVVTNGIEIL